MRPDVPQHDAVMGLKWLARVEAQRVSSPKCIPQLDRLKYGSRWLVQMAYTGSKVSHWDEAKLAVSVGSVRGCLV